MRDIKFRGKRIDNGEWVYGFYYRSTYNHRNYIEDLVDTRAKEVDPNTVGQYIGLPDKNAEEIYEGDTVRMHYFSEGLSGNLGVFEKDNEVVGDIQYRPDYAVYVVNTKEQDYVISELLQEPSEELEVIDNIHDNPELLKEAK